MNSRPVWASAVLVLRTPDAVFVAADMAAHTSGLANQFRYCKMVASHSAVAAFAGLSGVGNFDIRALLREVVTPDLPFPERVRHLDALMQRVLPTLVEAAVKYSPAFQKTLQRERGRFLAVVLAGDDRGVPTWVVRYYKADLAHQRTRIRVQAVACGRGCRGKGAAMLGGTPGMKEALDHTKRDTLAQDWPAEATRLIGIGARQSRTIALPAAAARVDGTGVHWLAEQPECLR